MKKWILLLVLGLLMCCNVDEPTVVGEWNLNVEYENISSSQLEVYDGLLITFNLDGTGDSPTKQPVTFEWGRDDDVVYITSELFDLENNTFGIELLNDDGRQLYNILELTNTSCKLERTFLIRPMIPSSNPDLIEYRETMYLER